MHSKIFPLNYEQKLLEQQKNSNQSSSQNSSFTEKVFDGRKIYQNILMGVIRQVFMFTVITIGILWAARAFHIIDEAHIGVYKRGGALINTWAQPRLHLMLPFHNKVQSSPNHPSNRPSKNISCGTSSGVLIHFGKVEVVNRLKKSTCTRNNKELFGHLFGIFSKIHHEINQFCSSHTLQEVVIDMFNISDQSLRESLQKGCDQWAPGIQIIAVRVTKPKRFPAFIAQTYQDREIQRKKLLIRRSEQKLLEKETQIEKRVQKIKAQTGNMIAEINNKMRRREKQASKTMNNLQNEITVLRESANAKAKKCISFWPFRLTRNNDELNQKRIIPEKQIANWLTNIKNTNKHIYEDSISAYIEEANKIGKEQKKNK